MRSWKVQEEQSREAKDRSLPQKRHAGHELDAAEHETKLHKLTDVRTHVHSTKFGQCWKSCMKNAN